LAKTNASPRRAYDPRAAAASRPVAVSSDAVGPALESPARALQRELSDRLSAHPPRKWSARTTLLFVLVTCGGFWLALGAVLAGIH